MGKILSDKAIEAAEFVYCGDALVRYFEHRIQPGSAFTAILENDLMGVYKRGDMTTLRTLQEIMTWLYNYAPANLFGSKEAVDNYLAGPATEEDLAVRSEIYTPKVYKSDI